MKINGQITVADFELAANKHSKAKRKKILFVTFLHFRVTKTQQKMSLKTSCPCRIHSTSFPKLFMCHTFVD